ncbi:MAG: Transketolase 1 [Holosporales bacterium]
MVENAKSGHPGMPMGMADVLTVLFQKYLRFDPKNPNWSERDRLILSGGHGSALLYSALYLTGYTQPTIDDLKTFRRLGSPCAGHPEYGHLPGIETTTGPLGQGIGNAVGMAIAQKIQELQSNWHYKIYVTVGDGDLMEGISHEVCALAGHLRLNNLILLFDDNQITIDGPTTISTSEDPLKRFEAYGFQTLRVDGHDEHAIDKAFEKAQAADRPMIIAFKTVIGKGAPNKQGTSHVHGSPLGEDEVNATRKALNWPHDPFYIPDHLLQTWRSFGTDSKESTTANVPKNIQSDPNMKQMYFDQKSDKATRILFQEVLSQYRQDIPSLIGGSADLTPSNNTKVKNQHAITADDFSGSYIHYGIREHGMAAIMNGLALCGFIPYGGTFLVFSDYMRPAMRLSALMKLRVLYVLTHDSIGLGEDGPTHQPVEHLCALRAIPNLYVFRPCDGAEMQECFEIAMNKQDAPSVFALTRQNIPYLRKTLSNQNLCEKGAYVLDPQDDGRALDVTLIASGSEVHLCTQAKARLKDLNIRVVSMPCLDLFFELSQDEKDAIIGTAKKYIVVEASLCISFMQALQGYHPLHVIGMTDFGASGPAPDLFKHFGITVEAIIEKIMAS